MIVLRHATGYGLLVEEIQLERDILYHELRQLKDIIFYPSQTNYLYGRGKYKQELLKAVEKEDIVIRNYEGKDSSRTTVGSPAKNAIVLSVLQELNRKAVTV